MPHGIPALVIASIVEVCKRHTVTHSRLFSTTGDYSASSAPGSGFPLEPSLNSMNTCAPPRLCPGPRFITSITFMLVSDPSTSGPPAKSATPSAVRRSWCSPTTGAEYTDVLHAGQLGEPTRPAGQVLDEAVLSEPEFTDAVRAALRALHTPELLRANPLVKSRAVRRHGPSGRDPPKRCGTCSRNPSPR